MTTTHDIFSSFDDAIRLLDDDMDTGLKRILDCVAPLATKYYPDDDVKLGEKITLIGSMAKDTGVKPLGDADVLFHLPVDTYLRFKNYAGNGQSALLQEVREQLKQRYPRTDIRGDGPVVVVKFNEEPAVELVPAVLDLSHDLFHADCLVPVTRDGGTWEPVDYGAQWEEFTTWDAVVNGQLRRLMRYLKMWRKTTNAQIKSIVLEAMAIEFIKTWDRERTSHNWDDWLVRDFLVYMVDNYVTTYYMPGIREPIDTGYGWYSAARQSREDAKTACGFKPEEFSYRYYWRKVLGDKFGA